MAHDPEDQPGVLDALLMPLRLPRRVVADVEAMSRAVLSLQRSAQKHLPSIDEHAGILVDQIDALQATLERVESRVANVEGQLAKLTGLETTIEERMEALREDLNTRMLAVEQEVRAMRPPMEQMAFDVQKIGKLLPDPNDGPLTRLKDTLKSS